MIHLVTLNPALDLSLSVREPLKGKIGEVLAAEMEAGGKALNVARFLKKMGVPSIIWLGTGGGSHPTHAFYRSLLKKEKLNVRFLGGKAPVRINAIIQNDKKSKKYNHPGFELDLTSFPRLYKILKKGDLLVMTGRLPLGMSPGFYASWIRAFERKGIKTIVDTSGNALKEALKEKPWFFKVNLFELSEALNLRFTSLRQVYLTIPKLIKSGLAHGAVTNGAEGALLWAGHKACWVRSLKKVRNSLVVGAGDGFLAGYLKGHLARKSLEDCAKQACAAGTSVALSGIQGFEKGLFRRQSKKVKVKRLA